MIPRSLALLALLLWQGGPVEDAPMARPERMQYLRLMEGAGAPGQACAVLDAQVFPHAAPAVTDLRLFPAPGATVRGGSAADLREVPYVITLSESQTEETQPAKVLNLGTAIAAAGGSANLTFDLEMPERAYTDVLLELSGQDFLATAKVSGTNQLGAGAPTALGAFTLFDLTSQHLSRDTTLPLQESTFRYLHIVLTVAAAPGAAAAGTAPFTPAMVTGAQVPPSREEETLYTTVAETTSLATKGRQTVATFSVPARVPVERVSFVLPDDFKGNFSRDVRVTATSAPGDDAAGDSGRAPLPEVVTGTILRVHSTQAGREIRHEQLSVPAILGANLQRAAKVEVALENGDDQALAIAAVRLEMRQRRLCFEVPEGAPRLALYYGDPALRAPVYDYERLFVASHQPMLAALGPERHNPDYRPPAEAARAFTERHPEVLWIALIAVILALAVVALRSSRTVGR